MFGVVFELSDVTPCYGQTDDGLVVDPHAGGVDAVVFEQGREFVGACGDTVREVVKDDMQLIATDVALSVVTSASHQRAQNVFVSVDAVGL